MFYLFYLMFRYCPVFDYLLKFLILKTKLDLDISDNTLQSIRTPKKLLGNNPTENDTIESRHKSLYKKPEEFKRRKKKPKTKFTSDYQTKDMELDEESKVASNFRKRLEIVETDGFTTPHHE